MTDKELSQAAAQAEEEMGWHRSRPRMKVAGQTHYQVPGSLSGLVIFASSRGVVQPLVMRSVWHQTSHLTHAQPRKRPKIDSDENCQFLFRTLRHHHPHWYFLGIQTPHAVSQIPPKLTMASQLLPLGEQAPAICGGPAQFANFVSELIDKCVGSRIWVIMKGDKGLLYRSTTRKKC